MKQKRILFLGGSKFQLPPIKYAKSQGHYVITCDYLPDNPGHAFADEYHNVSTTDLKAVLELAESLKIDGVVAYASDPAAPTCAYVGNKLGLPSNPYESVLTLARKDLFRAFLDKHNFHTPISRSFYDKHEAFEFASSLGVPFMIKPVDSSGSKGIRKIETLDDFDESFEYAMQFSREKMVVIEDFFVRSGYQVAGDGFIVDGKLAFRCFANEHFDYLVNAHVPIGESFPSIAEEWQQSEAHTETQRLLDLLGMKTGALNFDYHYDKNGKFSFLELGPRNGGNLIPEVICYATGVDLVKYTVDAALGLDCSELEMTETKGFYSCYMVHALKDGIVTDLWYSDIIKKKILTESIEVKIGEYVNKFDGSNHTLGTMILKFDSREEMLHMMDHMEEYFRVVVK
jgi:biotin carboxylase